MDFYTLCFFIGVWTYLGLGYYITMFSIELLKKDSDLIYRALETAKQAKPLSYFILVAISTICWLPAYIAEIIYFCCSKKRRKEVEEELKKDK